MRITIHRGSHKIGGNCIEISTETSRIILDVGMPLFDDEREPYDTAILRRQSPNDLRNLGILPTVPGLFETGPSPDAILISHAHEDHTGLIQHSQSEIPIYAGVGTSKMMLAGAKFAGQQSIPRNRYQELLPRLRVPIGDFTITAFPVDHSVYGAQAFLIEAEGKTVLYSGDLRMHGRKPGMHRSLIESVKDRAIDALLMEGTHIGHPDHRGPNEYELEEEITDRIRSAPGLVLASFSPQHVDRLVGFFRAAKKTNRTFIADAYTAFVMHLIASETSIPRPESTDGVKVFFPKFFEETFRKKRMEEFYFLMSPARIGMEEIQSNPSKYVMLFRPSMLESDLNGIIPQKSLCLYSRWSGYLNQPEWAIVQDALAKANGELIEAHTSGHIFYDDIVNLTRQINPKLVIPVHTFEPEKFHHALANVKVLEDGETLHLQ